MNDLVSVIVPTYNRVEKLKKCLGAVCDQSYKNIQIIVADDGSQDDTVAIVEKLIAVDPRIKLLRNPVNLGASAARNLAIRETLGEIILFIDDDVIVSPDWIESCLKVFASNDCLGVEGRIFYVSETYRPRYRDRVVCNLTGGHYMTANMAYKKEALLEAGMFNESIRVMHDRDVAMRVLKHGSIVFGENVTVQHMLDPRTIRSYFKEARLSAGWVQYNVLNNEKNFMTGRIYRPVKLLTLLFPPLILGNLFTARFTGPYDYLLLALLYPRLWYERFLVWKWAISYKKFII